MRGRGASWQCLALAPSYARFATQIDWKQRPVGGVLDCSTLLATCVRIAGALPDVIAIDIPLSTRRRRHSRGVGLMTLPTATRKTASAHRLGGAPTGRCTPVASSNDRLRTPSRRLCRAEPSQRTGSADHDALGRCQQVRYEVHATSKVFDAPA